MVSGRLAAGKTSLGTSARALTGWLEAGRELSRELPNTSGDACAINAPARSALECRVALSARPWEAAAHTTGCSWSATCRSTAAAWPMQAQQQYRALHLTASDRGSSSGRAGDDVAPSLHDAGEPHPDPTLTELCTLAQDCRRHALEANQHHSNSSINSINGGIGAHGSALAEVGAAPDAPHFRPAEPAHYIPAILVERTCTMLDKRLRSGVFSAPAKSRRGSHGGGGGGGSAATAAADVTNAVQRRVASEALAAMITSVARCLPCDGRSPPPPPPPDLARSLVAAATAAANTAPWPQAAAMLQGAVRMRTVGKTFLDRILARTQRIPLEQELAGAPHPGTRVSRGALPPPAAARKGAQQGLAAAAGPSAHAAADDAAAAAPSAGDAISLLRSLSALHSLQPVAAAAPNLGGAMRRLMAHLQARLHTLPGPEPLLGLLRDVTSCGWRHDREPEFLCRVADYLCARAPPAEPAARAAAAAAGGTAAVAGPFSDGDVEVELARPPRLLALTPSQVVEVLCMYARSGVSHARLMERGLDAVDACLPALTPSQAARVAEACSRFSHLRPRPAVMRRLALHVAAHLELPQARTAEVPEQARQPQEVGPRPEALQPRAMGEEVGPQTQVQARPHAQEDLPPRLSLERCQLPQQQVEQQAEQQAELQAQDEPALQLQLRPAGGLPVAPGDVAASVAAMARCGVRDERFLGAIAAYAAEHAAALLAEAEEQARALAGAQGDRAEAQAKAKALGPPAREQQGAAAAAAEGVACGEPAALQGAAAADHGAAAAAALREAASEVSGEAAAPGEAGCLGSPPFGSPGIRGAGCTGAGVRESSQRAAAAGRPGVGAQYDRSTTDAVQLRNLEADCSAWRQEPLGAQDSCSAEGTSAVRPPGEVVGAGAGLGEQAGVPVSGAAEPALAHRTAVATRSEHLRPEASVLGQPVTDHRESGDGGAAADEVAMLEAMLTPPPALDSAPAGHGHGFQVLEAGVQPPPPPPAPPQQPHTSPPPGPPEVGGRGASLVHTADAGSGESGRARLATDADADAAAGLTRCAAASQCASPREDGGVAADAAVARDGLQLPGFPALSPLRGVSLERLEPGRTALVLRRLSPALPPRELLGELLAVPGAIIDLYYMPYDYAAVSRGRPGLGCAFLGVTSTDSVAALARRLQEGSICRGAERAVLEYVPAANSDALLRALFSPASGYSVRGGTDTASRPLLLYVSGALRGKMQPIEPKGVELHDMSCTTASHRHAAAPGPFILPQLQQLQPPPQQHRQPPPPQQQRQQQQAQAQVSLLPSSGHLDSGTTPAHQQTSVLDRGSQPHSEQIAATPPPVGCGDGNGGQTHGSPPRRSDSPLAQPDPDPDPSPPRSGRQLLDVQQLALIAHSMAVLSYHPPSMLEALGRLMRRLLQPALQDPSLVLALATLPPPPAAVDPGAEAEAGPGAGPSAAPAAPAAAEGGGDGGVDGSPAPLLPPMPPLKSVLHSLHALTSQPHPDPATCGELANVCAAALSAWAPGGSRCKDGPAATLLSGTKRSAAVTVALPPPEVLDILVRLLAQVLTACADHGQLLYHPRLCDAAAALLRHRLRALRMRAACALLQPLVRLRHPPAGRLVAAVAPLLAQDCGRLSAASLVDLAWACARTGCLWYDDGGDGGGDGGGGDGGGDAAGTQVVRALALRTGQLLHQLPTAGVVQMFWALAALGYDGRGGGAAAANNNNGPDLYWQLLQVLLHRYDLGARDLLLLQEGMELRQRWRRRQRRWRHGPPGLGMAEPAAAEAAAAADSGDLMESFLQELMYRAGAVAGVEGVADGLIRKRFTAEAGPVAAAAVAIPLPGPQGPVARAVGSRSLAPGPSAGALPSQPAAGEEGSWDAAAGAERRHGCGASRASSPLRMGSESPGSGEGDYDEPRVADVAVAAGREQQLPTRDEEPLAAAPGGAAPPGPAAVQAAAAAAAASSPLPALCTPQTTTTPAPAPASAPSPPDGTTVFCIAPCRCTAREARIGLLPSVSSSGGVGSEADSRGCRDGRAAAAAAAAAAAGEQGAGEALAGGGLLQQILVARRGLALDEADGVLMRLQVPEALLARARAMSAAAATS
ncbi:hypothetical protein PLESTB_001144000 [Pleodorina starrii]|uniref:Uncharacterized protein n=1 Tax=Pleodorina starrii TaxID=330485 RepID=A0A9W6F539_9CHLO|nr:hypothetical protein PLESTM_000560500 [Pleodorina starrii]GLC56772.1 hypothetical protein PLESTB_001144000 [Pleodorina starrii]GLC66928.1 hypothetical protein PLESTF_000491300 [Pleodorina starrii]